MMKHTLFSLSILVLCNSCGDRKEEANIRDLSKVNNTISTCSFIEQVDFIPLHEKIHFYWGKSMLYVSMTVNGIFWIISRKQRLLLLTQ